MLSCLTYSQIVSMNLSNDIESCIADFFGSMTVSDSGINCEEFCDLVGDKVLAEYASGFQFNYSGWMKARELRRTGYGSPNTTAILGPVYLVENRKIILDFLKRRLHEIPDDIERKAIWYSSDVPLWGANGDDLCEFTRKLENTLSYQSETKGTLTVLCPSKIKLDCWDAKRRFETKIKHGVQAIGDIAFDRVELLLIPGVMAVVQYHAQPHKGSCVTVPIGYLTVEKERLDKLELMFKSRVQLTDKLNVLWPQSIKLHQQLLPSGLFPCTERPQRELRTARRNVKVTVKKRRYSQ